MIYDTTISTMHENDILSLLENAEDRFEYCTIAEATAITVAEQEENWNRFMKGIGFSELSTVMEGEEVIYEGGRLKSFFEKAKAYFKMALNKLAEITKSFIAKFDQFAKTNAGFLKKYERTLLNIEVPSDFEFKGYTFKNMQVPVYEETPGAVKITSKAVAASVEAGGDLSKEAAEEALLPGASGDSFTEKLTNYFYGEKEKDTLSNINVKAQIDILKNTKTNKSDAKKSYTKAAERIKKFIKQLEKDEKEIIKKEKDVETGQAINSTYSKVITYWKYYASCAHQKHGAYMGALGKRNSQAKAICTKLLTTSNKATNKAKRAEINPNKDKKVETEGFIDTGDFLGAVEFI